MPIVLVRHADAVPETSSLPDEHRYLSIGGRAQARELGALLAEAGLVPGLVVSSPLARALQTAELVVRALAWQGAVEVNQRLAPGLPSLRPVADWLTRLAGGLDAGTILIAVGHEPSISALASTLSGATAPSFGKAEACLIEGGALRWRIQPD